MGIAGLVRVMMYKLIGMSNSPPITTIAIRVECTTDGGFPSPFSFRSTMRLDFHKQKMLIVVMNAALPCVPASAAEPQPPTVVMQLEF